MLKLCNITKIYGKDIDRVDALRGVDIEFRRNEFVSILGPSGCGKTTLLNIVGGLDRYTDGDLIIEGFSTKLYKENEWNNYRNKKIGFVFQSYNLIPHLTVLKNVELSLTISGVDAHTRKKRALAVLEDVGLSDKANKRPNQLSGGQMQRVAIARALINEPEVILADEPTGALDSESGLQVLDLLKEVAKDRLVIMVTHNGELAEKYSTRIVKLSDGLVVEDSSPYESHENKLVCKGEEESIEVTKPFKKTTVDKIKVLVRNKKKTGEKSSMSLGTALSLSLRNLMSKKGRTIITSTASSIGIIGIILILALSAGASGYIRGIEENSLSYYPINIQKSNINISAVMSIMMKDNKERPKYPKTDVIYTKPVVGDMWQSLGELGTEIFQSNDLAKIKVYIDENKDELREFGYVRYSYGTEMNVYCNYVGADDYMKTSPFQDSMDVIFPQLGFPATATALIKPYANMITVWDELVDNPELLRKQYDLIGTNSKWPSNPYEVIVVINERNELEDYALFALGLKGESEIKDVFTNPNSEALATTYTVDELLNLEYKILTKADYYYYNEETELWKRHDKATKTIDFIEGKNLDGDDNAITLKVVGVVRAKQGVSATSINGMVGYLPALNDILIDRLSNSPVVKAQQESNKNILTGAEINENAKPTLLTNLGVIDPSNPKSIKLYANSFEDKEKLVAFLEKYHTETGEKVKYSDQLDLIMGFVEKMTQTITAVLVGFSAISLVVSSIMIAIIIYTSVLERRKEIGVLRSLGARRWDISNVFNAESSLIGLLSGLIGSLIAFLIILPVNLILFKLLEVSNLIRMEWWHVVMMCGISTILSLIAGIIPSQIAANRDPATALRSE